MTAKLQVAFFTSEDTIVGEVQSSVKRLSMNVIISQIHTESRRLGIIRILCLALQPKESSDGVWRFGRAEGSAKPLLVGA